MNSESTFMKDMQAHTMKIRSDAAECLMLSNLVTEEKRDLFARIAEHLNSLALEIETDMATRVADPPIPPPAQPDLIGHKGPADHIGKASRARRQLASSFLLALILVGGVFFWTMNRAEMSSFLFANFHPKTDPAGSDANERLAAFLSGETRDREAIKDQLSTLNSRLDGLVKELDHQKSSLTAILTSAAKPSLGRNDETSTAEIKPSAAEEKGTRLETSSTLPVRPAAPEVTSSAQPATANANREVSDQVGTIAPIRAELDQRKLTVGRASCLQFRSYDPASGTYTTFDGRRRPCP
jgi:BA14K-like protein